MRTTNKPYDLHVPTVLKSWSLSLLEPSGPVQACNGIALPLPLLEQQDHSNVKIKMKTFMCDNQSLEDGSRINSVRSTTQVLSTHMQLSQGSTTCGQKIPSFVKPAYS
jgi:hypothetical protein